MPQPKPVYKYDLDGNFLAAYDSISIAAKRNNRQFSSVRKAAKGDYSFTGDYIFSHVRRAKIEPVFKSKYETMRKRFRKVIAQKDSRVVEFESVSEAARFIGCHRSAISQIINNSAKNNFKTIYGWSVANG